MPLGVSVEWHQLRLKLYLYSKLRLMGDFGPSPASGAAIVEGAEKCQALVRRAIRLVAFLDANNFEITTCA